MTRCRAFGLRSGATARDSGRRCLVLLWTIALVGVAMVGSAGSSQAGAADSTVDVPASIDATGGLDVTAALNDLLATAPPGTTIRFPKGGRFRVEGIVLIDGRTDLTIEGNGSTLVAKTDGRASVVPLRNYRNHWPRMREHVDIRRSNQIVVRDLTVVGPNPSGRYDPQLEAQAGFAVSSSRGVTLDGVTVRATFGDGVYVVGTSADVTIKDCTLDHNGRQGVAVVGGVNVTVTQCSITDTGRSTIDLEPARGRVENVHITDNEVRNPTNFLLAAVGAGVGVNEVWLERNRVSGGRGVSVYVGTERSPRTGIHILNNVGTGVSAGYEGTLLRFERFDGIEVRGNRQRVAAGVTPIRLINSCHDAVVGNDFSQAGPVVTRDGDCSTPLPAGRRAQPGAAPRPSSGSRPIGPPSRRTPTTSASSTGPRPRDDAGDDSSMAVAIALIIGLLAGVAATVGFQRTRRPQGD